MALGPQERLPGLQQEGAALHELRADQRHAICGQDAPFIETLDYIWFSPNGLSVVDCPKLPLTKEEVSGPFPNVQEPSDHLPLRATLRVSSPMLQSRL
mmetsp:Transcript_69986/g.227847  ORF Transcript_69986/g.227847 Transcript_69986/m.227847 type:complete len:98 (-) Transcript_69986:76-369(-)